MKAVTESEAFTSYLETLKALAGQGAPGGGGGTPPPGGPRCMHGSPPLLARRCQSTAALPLSASPPSAAPPAAGEDTAGMEEAYLWSQLLSNFTSGLCNVVSDFDLYAQGETGGVMINNGTVTIGCGLGAPRGCCWACALHQSACRMWRLAHPGPCCSPPRAGMWGGKANTTITGDLAAQLGIPSTVVGIGAGMAVESPQGSWLNLVRFGEDDPLAFCGLEVCAKPADAAATS